MRPEAMVLLATLPIGIVVHHHAAEVGQVMERSGAGRPARYHAICHGQPGGHRHAHVSVQAVTDPTSAHIRHFCNTRDVRSSVDDLLRPRSPVNESAEEP